MERRKFITRVAIASGVGTLSHSAMAQNAPVVKWRMSTSWPKSLDNLYGSAEELCKRVGELTDGKFDIRCFAGGEIIPPAQNMDAISNGTVECNHVLASAYIGKNPALAFDAGLAFGLNSRQHNAWIQNGGGMTALREVYKKYGIVNFVCGNVGVQMGGWFRKEIKTVADFKGLKFRIGGMGGMVLAKMGAVVQQLPPADIYSSLEKGTIDAAEWIGPHDDERLGLHKVAKYYYAPGWWEGSASITTMVNSKAWEALSASHKAAFECACNEQTTKMLAKYDAANPDALKRLIGQGAKVTYFPKAVMDASYKASMELFDELSISSPDFKAIYPQWRAFRKNQAAWFRVADAELDNYTFSAVAREP